MAWHLVPLLVSQVAAIVSSSVQVLGHVGHDVRLAIKVGSSAELSFQKYELIYFSSIPYLSTRSN